MGRRSERRRFHSDVLWRPEHTGVHPSRCHVLLQRWAAVIGWKPFSFLQITVESLSDDSLLFDIAQWQSCGVRLKMLVLLLVTWWENKTPHNINKNIIKKLEIFYLLWIYVFLFRFICLQKTFNSTQLFTRYLFLSIFCHNQESQSLIFFCLNP